MQIFPITLFQFSVSFFFYFTKDSNLHDNRTTDKEILKDRRHRAIILPAHNYQIFFTNASVFNSP